MLVVLLAFRGIADDTSEANGVDSTAEVSAAANEFGFRLFRELAQEDEGNIVISPLSISMALSMTSRGASGDTLSQMREVLGAEIDENEFHEGYREVVKTLSKSLRESKLKLQLRNGIWVQQGLPVKAGFSDVLREYYRVRLRSADFKAGADVATKEINAWISNAAGGRISDMVSDDELNPLTRLVLVNTIYFQGRWAGRFSRANTLSAPFTVYPGKRVKADLMYQRGSFGYLANESEQVLRMPYVGGRLSMLVVLPRTPDSLEKLYGRLSQEQIRAWFSGLEAMEVDVYFPRFSFETTKGLRRTLVALGMPNAFDLANADFSRISDAEPLHLHDVKHRAGVEVDEDGTTAWAATTTIIEGWGTEDRSGPPVFRADHPFLFLIGERKTGAILFVGRVVNPSKK